MSTIEACIASRVTAKTDWNDESSRSHCVFTLSDILGRWSVNFADLAGSEKYTNQDLEETRAINNSLLTLRRVI